MAPSLRIATRRDARSLLRVRAEWLDRFCQAHPAPERWCPAMAPVPWLEQESTILQHLSRTDDRAWAADVGPEAVGEVEARMRGWAAAEVEKNLAVSRTMWSVADRDWLAAYEGRTPVGVVRMAVTREGVGVVDAFGLAKEHRGRGLGIHLLAAGLARLAGQTDVVWLDVDLDNVPALRVYQRAGLHVHHLDGSMTLEFG